MPPAIHPTNHLVVCGAIKENDSWLFGDFLGFTSTLKELSVYGAFINYFDLDAYFTKTGYDDIKFGDMGLVANWFMKWSTTQRRAEAMQETFHGLAFRFLVQGQLLLVAEDFVSQGLVTIESLYTPMSISASPNYSTSVTPSWA